MSGLDNLSPEKNTIVYLGSKLSTGSMARVKLRESFPDYVVAHFSKLSHVKYNFNKNRINPKNVALVFSESDLRGDMVEFLKEKGYRGTAIFLRNFLFPERRTPNYEHLVQRNLSNLIEVTREHLPN